MVDELSGDVRQVLDGLMNALQLGLRSGLVVRLITLNSIDLAAMPQVKFFLQFLLLNIH